MPCPCPAAAEALSAAAEALSAAAAELSAAAARAARAAVDTRAVEQPGSDQSHCWWARGNDVGSGSVGAADRADIAAAVDGLADRDRTLLCRQHRTDDLRFEDLHHRAHGRVVGSQDVGDGVRIGIEEANFFDREAVALRLGGIGGRTCSGRMGSTSVFGALPLGPKK